MTCLPMIRHLFDIIIVVSTDKGWKVIETVVSHLICNFMLLIFNNNKYYHISQVLSGSHTLKTHNYFIFCICLNYTGT